MALDSERSKAVPAAICARFARTLDTGHLAGATRAREARNG
jgi:hypothetical protein